MAWGSWYTGEREREREKLIWGWNVQISQINFGLLFKCHGIYWKSGMISRTIWSSNGSDQRWQQLIVLIWKSFNSCSHHLINGWAIWSTVEPIRCSTLFLLRDDSRCFSSLLGWFTLSFDVEMAVEARRRPNSISLGNLLCNFVEQNICML